MFWGGRSGVERALQNPSPAPQFLLGIFVRSTCWASWRRLCDVVGCVSAVVRSACRGCRRCCGGGGSDTDGGDAGEDEDEAEESAAEGGAGEEVAGDSASEESAVVLAMSRCRGVVALWGLSDGQLSSRIFDDIQQRRI